MIDIPEEIRKMFPDQPIHKMDVNDNGELYILASSEPLEGEPDFENMPIEQVNQYLRDHGYDPEQVAIRGKILTDALIENIDLKSRAEKAAEAELAALREQTQKHDPRVELPPECEEVIVSVFYKNGYKIWKYDRTAIKIGDDDVVVSLCAFRLREKWMMEMDEKLGEDGEKIKIIDWRYFPLPEPPEGE